MSITKPREVFSLPNVHYAQIFKVMYQHDFMVGTYSMGELFPLWQLADYKQFLEELGKGFEVVDAK